MHKQGSTLLVGGSVGVVDVGGVDFVCGGAGFLSLFFPLGVGSSACGRRETRRRTSASFLETHTHAHLSWLMRMVHLRGGGGWWAAGYGCGWVAGWACGGGWVMGDVLR